MVLSHRSGTLGRRLSVRRRQRAVVHRRVAHTRHEDLQRAQGLLVSVAHPRRSGESQGHRKGRAAQPRYHLGDLSRSEEHTSELQSLRHLVCRLLLEKKTDYRGPGRPRRIHTADEPPPLPSPRDLPFFPPPADSEVKWSPVSAPEVFGPFFFK